ncbi:MAG: OmpH family outer membrane protein [Lentisphaeria bacterium]|nr:OmpH family outer membrane protein [Lentisphaeria bacterium]
MVTKTLLFVLGAGLVLTLGCSRQESAPQTVVLDLDRVAAATGWDQQFKEAMAKKEQDLNTQINAAKTSLESEIKALGEQFGATPTQEQKTQFNQYTQQANQRMQQLLGSARQENAVYKNKLVNSFREKIRPYAEKIAARRGAGIVALKADPLYIVRPESDITGAVIEALQGVSLTTVDTRPADAAPAPVED